MKKILILLLLGCLSVTGCVKGIKKEVTITTPIASLGLAKDFNIRGGGGFLGWSIDSSNTQYYWFYKITGADEYLLSKVNAETTKIVESNIESPQYRYKFMYWCNPEDPTDCWEPYTPVASEFTLVVPKGTIVRQFKVELPK